MEVTPLHLATAITRTSTGNVQLGTLTLHTTEARAVMVRIGECIGEAVGDWVGVRDRLDAMFAGSFPVKVRDLTDKTSGTGMMIKRPCGTRADLRIGDFTTALLVRSGRRWTGFVAEWAPDAVLGMGVRGTLRRVAVNEPRQRRLGGA